MLERHAPIHGEMCALGVLGVVACCVLALGGYAELMACCVLTLGGYAVLMARRALGYDLLAVVPRVLTGCYSLPPVMPSCPVCAVYALNAREVM